MKARLESDRAAKPILGPGDREGAPVEPLSALQCLELPLDDVVELEQVHDRKMIESALDSTTQLSPR